MNEASTSSIPRRKSSLVLVRMHNTFLEFSETTAEPSTRRRFSTSVRRSCTDPRVPRRSSESSIVTLPGHDLRSCEEQDHMKEAPRRDRAQTAAVMMNHIKKELNHKIFVGGLSSSTDESTLYEFMNRFGPIKNVTVKRNPLTGQSRRYAFVKFYGPPSPWIFQQSWVLEDHPIRISKYQVSSEWKNHYYSDEGDE